MILIGNEKKWGFVIIIIDFVSNNRISGSFKALKFISHNKYYV